MTAKYRHTPQMKPTDGSWSWFGSLSAATRNAAIAVNPCVHQSSNSTIVFATSVSSIS